MLQTECTDHRNGFYSSEMPSLFQLQINSKIWPAFGDHFLPIYFSVELSDHDRLVTPAIAYAVGRRFLHLPLELGTREGLLSAFTCTILQFNDSE
jgi:hypothetical protein